MEKVGEVMSPACRTIRLYQEQSSLFAGVEMGGRRVYQEGAIVLFLHSNMRFKGKSRCLGFLKIFREGSDIFPLGNVSSNCNFLEKSFHDPRISALGSHNFLAHTLSFVIKCHH